MIVTTKAVLRAVIVAVTAAVVLIAGCGSITSSGPVALAGANQTAKVGTIVTLDGSESSAPGGGALTYDWSFSAAPRESAVSLANHASDRPSFTPDKAGTYVISLVVKDSAGKASAPDETHVTVVPAGRSDTKIIITSASKKDLWLGDQVTTTGRLVDAEGNGISNQTINFKSVARVLGLTVDNRLESVTTDSTGAFTKVTPISAQGAPSLINTVQVEGWIEYAGNDFYKPTSTSHVQVTVHLTSAPGS